MNLQNVKHQGKTSKQLAFHVSAYSHFGKLSEACKVQAECLKI